MLLGLLALVVVPLGVSLSTRERQDFAHSAQSAADSLAAIAEETLGDRSKGLGDVASVQLPVESGDGAVLLDRHGQVVATAGRTVGPQVVEQVRSGRRPSASAADVSTALVGSTFRPDGTIVLVRDAGPLNRRIGALWVGLTGAAAISLAVGCLVAAGLAHWIGRPLRDLRAVAVRMGNGDVTERIVEPRGAPEVRSVAVAFNEMAGRIGSLLTSHRVMTAEVSHQLRTPLAALRLRLELLVDDAPEQLRAELLDTLPEIARLSRLVDGLLAVARADEVSASPEPVDVGAVIAERLEFWDAVAQERGVNLSEPSGTGVALATPGHLEQVLDNLIANAMDALDPGRSVRVSVRTDHAEVVVTVADDGPGMSEPHREAAFGRFVSDRSVPTKSGLGLAIVLRLVAADHGAATLEETDGGGLTAIVRLPAARTSASL